MKTVHEEQPFPRWWLSPSGELTPCDDHEFWARQYLHREYPDYQYAGIRDVYSRMMRAGWVRVVAEPDQLVFDREGELRRPALVILRDLSIERDLPLYDAPAMRIIERVLT